MSLIGETARCTKPTCPWRWATGQTRPCPWHAQDAAADSIASRMDALGVEMATAPGFPAIMTVPDSG